MKIGKISGFDAIPDRVGEADSEPESATTGDVFELLQLRRWMVAVKTLRSHRHVADSGL